MPATKPFDFLEKSLNCCIIDDDSGTRSFLHSILSRVGIFHLYQAEDSAAALRIWRSGVRMHVSVLDLGLADVNNDEFYLLRASFSSRCAVIVLTGSSSPAKGARCIQLGAAEVLEKGAAFDVRKFIICVLDHALITIINPRYKDNSGDTLSLATKVLLEKNPQSVTEWSDMLRITDRQLRNVWDLGNGAGAKQVLFLFSVYKHAFAYYTATMFANEKDVSPTIDPARYTKMKDYFLSHKDTLIRQLS